MFLLVIFEVSLPSLHNPNTKQIGFCCVLMQEIVHNNSSLVNYFLKFLLKGHSLFSYPSRHSLVQQNQKVCQTLVHLVGNIFSFFWTTRAKLWLILLTSISVAQKFCGFMFLFLFWFLEVHTLVLPFTISNLIVCCLILWEE